MKSKFNVFIMIMLLNIISITVNLRNVFIIWYDMKCNIWLIVTSWSLVLYFCPDTKWNNINHHLCFTISTLQCKKCSKGHFVANYIICIGTSSIYGNGFLCTYKVCTSNIWKHLGKDSFEKIPKCWHFHNFLIFFCMF